MKKETSILLKKIFSLQNIGLALAVIACIVFWLPVWKYDEIHGFWFFKKVQQATLDLKPNLISGIVALVLLMVLYVRGILSFSNMWVGIVSFIINLTLFSTLIEIFISPGKESAKSNPIFQNVILIVASCVCIAILIFGVKEIAKIVLLIFCVGIFYFNLKLVSDAMGIWGYINLVFVLVSFFLQQNINVASLGKEFKYLFSGVSKNVKDAAASIEGSATSINSLTETQINALVDKRISESLRELQKTSDKTKNHS